MTVGIRKPDHLLSDVYVQTDLLRCSECDRGFHIDCIHPSRQPQSAGNICNASVCDGSVLFPAAEFHDPLSSTKLYHLVTEALVNNWSADVKVG